VDAVAVVVVVVVVVVVDRMGHGSCSGLTWPGPRDCAYIIPYDC